MPTDPATSGKSGELDLEASPLFDLELSEALSNLDVDLLLDEQALPREEGAEGAEPAASDRFDTSHLLDLGRDLSTQYVDVVANYASEVFASVSPDASRAQVLAALANLADLSAATHDHALAARVKALAAIVDEAVPRGKRDRSRYVTRLREAIESFGELLDGEGRTRLLRIVRYRVHGDPVLGFLQGIRGVGKKRLERLYLAGLNDLDRLVDADADDIALVAGLPLSVAMRVQRESRAFAEAERKRALHALSERADWLMRSIGDLDPTDEEQLELIRSARKAMQHLENMLARLEAT